MTTKKEQPTSKTQQLLIEAENALSDDTRNFKQDFIAFRPKELEAIRKAELLYREKFGAGGRGRIIGIACGILAQILEEPASENGDEAV